MNGDRINSSSSSSSRSSTPEPEPEPEPPKLQSLISLEMEDV
jgi:hypothetical protein